MSPQVRLWPPDDEIRGSSREFLADPCKVALNKNDSVTESEMLLSFPAIAFIFGILQVVTFAESVWERRQKNDEVETFSLTMTFTEFSVRVAGGKAMRHCTVGIAQNFVIFSAQLGLKKSVNKNSSPSYEMDQALVSSSSTIWKSGSSYVNKVFNSKLVRQLYIVSRSRRSIHIGSCSRSPRFSSAPW